MWEVWLDVNCVKHHIMDKHEKKDAKPFFLGLAVRGV